MRRSMASGAGGSTIAAIAASCLVRGRVRGRVRVRIRVRVRVGVRVRVRVRVRVWVQVRVRVRCTGHGYPGRYHLYQAVRACPSH